MMQQLAKGPLTGPSHRLRLASTHAAAARPSYHIIGQKRRRQDACFITRPLTPSAGVNQATWSGCCQSYSLGSSSSSSSSNSSPVQKLRWLPPLIGIVVAAHLGLQVHTYVLEHTRIKTLPPINMSPAIDAMAKCTAAAVASMIPFVLLEKKWFTTQPPVTSWLLVAAIGALIGAGFALPYHICPVVVAAIPSGICYWLVSTVIRSIIKAVTKTFKPGYSTPPTSATPTSAGSTTTSRSANPPTLSRIKYQPSSFYSRSTKKKPDSESSTSGSAAGSTSSDVDEYGGYQVDMLLSPSGGTPHYHTIVVTSDSEPYTPVPDGYSSHSSDSSYSSYSCSGSSSSDSGSDSGGGDKGGCDD